MDPLEELEVGYFLRIDAVGGWGRVGAVDVYYRFSLQLCWGSFGVGVVAVLVVVSGKGIGPEPDLSLLGISEL